VNVVVGGVKVVAGGTKVVGGVTTLAGPVVMPPTTPVVPAVPPAVPVVPGIEAPVPVPVEVAVPVEVPIPVEVAVLVLEAPAVPDGTALLAPELLNELPPQPVRTRRKDAATTNRVVGLRRIDHHTRTGNVGNDAIEKLEVVPAQHRVHDGGSVACGSWNYSGPPTSGM
jgi:hypothetical protein